jgi:hypothetical protein
MLQQTAQMTGLREVLDGTLEDFERANTAAMREAAAGLKEEYRDQVFGAGLGRKLAYTWQSEAYPKSGASMEPAGFVYSKAPKIISLFASGAVIRPLHGSRYLWIPTAAVPRSLRGGRGAKAKMTPEEVERHYNTDIFVRRGRGGNYLAYVMASPARSRRRRGAATRGPRARPEQPIHVFTLVRQVQGRKLLDLEGPAQRWAARYSALVEKHWGNR